MPPSTATRRPREVTVGQAIAAIESAKSSDRLSALDDLVFLFKSARLTDPPKLNDKDYHRTFEALFRCAVSEKSTYYKSRSGSTAAATRLAKCAEAFRLVVEHSVSRLKKKTKIAVIDHISQTLPTSSDDAYVQPLLLDYIKALAVLLAHPPNVETLMTYEEKTWFDCVDFVTQVIDWQVQSGIQDLTPSRDSPAPGTAQTFSLAVSTFRSTATSSTQRNASRVQKSVLHHLLECIQSLVSAPNAPVLKRSENVIQAVLRCIELRSLGLSSILQLGFSILNTVLATIQIENSGFVNLLVGELMLLVRQWWQAKTTSQDNALLNSIQTEVLKLLFNIHLNVEYMIRLGDVALLTELEDFCDMLWNEYSHRDPRAQLQQDDLTFSVAPRHSHTFQTYFFGLRPYNLEAERRWAVVHILALFEAVLWKQWRRQEVSQGEHNEQPRKKRRMSPASSRLLQKLQVPHDGMQLTALQIIPFFISKACISPDDVAEIISVMGGLLSHKNTRLSAWAMTAAASLAYASGASSHSHQASWKHLWYMATRNLGLSGNCRASCFLLCAILSNELLSYHDISDDINNIVTAADVSGPATVVDSSVILMTRLLQLRNHKLPSTSHATSSHVVRWLFLRWDPADPAFVSSYSHLVAPVDIINLLRAVCGLSQVALSGLPQLFIGSIGSTWSALQETESIVRYLLLLEETDSSIKTNNSQETPNTQAIAQAAETSDSHAIRKLVTELLLPKTAELQTLCDSWSRRGDGSTQISIDKLRSLLNYVLVVVFNLAYFNEVNLQQSQELDDALFKLLRDALGVALGSPGSRSISQHVLEIVRPYVPRFSTDSLNTMHKEIPHVFSLFSELSESYRERNSQQSSRNGVDPMDMDDDFGSQGSRSSIATKAPEVVRRESLFLDEDSFYFDTIQRLHFLCALHQDPEKIGLLPTEFLEELLALTDDEFLRCRLLNRELFAGDLIISPDDAMRVTERHGEIIGSRQFSSSEVAFHACLDIITGFAPVWTDERSELSSFVGRLYHFFLEDALPSHLLSPRTQIALARLLFRLTEINEKFPEGVNLPTTVTSLLKMLWGSDIRVQFYIGENLPRILQRFVLKTHDQVCMDIIDNLPGDPDVPGGIPLRLYVLSELAKSWSTLLRRCVYHIFETPGNVRDSIKHATYCLKSIATKLQLENAQKLFDLFAPQLLYTWLTRETIEAIPFEIFGFSRLDELLKRAEAEAAALMIMRGQDAEFSNLSKLLGLTPAHLVERCFSRTLAYSVAFDISLPKSDRQSSGESRIRKMMGRDPFIDNVYIHFADIIGIFFTLIDQEDPIEESWAKAEGFAYAAKAMNEIKSCAYSEIELAANQQPHFRARYLTREIALLCSRTEYDVRELWTPALVVCIARKLFNLIHPALGPLHTCSVIRKIRVVVCLAGEYAYESYPLEMLLQSLQPFLTDLESADDALGISQYLLSRGSSALERSPSFLAGYALSTLASLRVFLESSQASTTQESQFKGTMTKAQQFHKWLSRYLEQYESPHLRDEKQLSSFKAITQSAANVRSSGNSERGTNESNLLVEILRDERSDSQLLNESSRNLALNILSKDFKIPVSARRDAVSSDDEAINMASAVWKSSYAQSENKQHKQFRVWAGRVIGRSFAASGAIDLTLLRESKVTQYLKNSSAGSSSEQGVLSLLQALVATPDYFRAGLAESALRSIVSAAQEDNVLKEACQRGLTDQLYTTSNWGSYQTPPSDNCLVDTVPEALAFSVEAFEDSRWAQRLTIHLTQFIQNDTVLASLPPVLANIKGFAEDAFPFIVHLVLLSERDKQQSAKRRLSAALKDWLKLGSPEVKDHLGLLINALLYLRTQKFPGESSIADRSQWLDVDPTAAAYAATRCGMYKTALLTIESTPTEAARSSRRSSALRVQDSTDALLDIFENIDDPDAYYGLRTDASLSNVLSRLEYEKDSAKSLAFRGAQFDSHIRRRDPAGRKDEQHLVGTISDLGLSGLSHSLLQNQQSHDGTSDLADSIFKNARRLEVWNLPVPPLTENPSATLYKAFQGCYQAVSIESARQAIYNGLSQGLQNLTKRDTTPSKIRYNLGTLAALTELDDVLSISSAEELEDMLNIFNSRSTWMKSGRYADVSRLLSTRETTFSMLGKTLQALPNSSLSLRDARLAEAKSMLLSSQLYRYHQAHQESLNIATALNDLIKPSLDLGLTIDAAAKLEAANAMWDHEETVPSIHMLQSIVEASELKNQSILVRRSDLLAKIGYQVSVARLEKPDSIQKHYLQPALKELKGKVDGQEAGQVYHQFAMFCDEQLQNPDGLEDLARLQHLRRGKSEEVSQLQQLITGTRDSQVRNRYQNHLAKAKQWLDLDEQELRRLEQSRSEFVRLSLENYLLSLTASDEHNNDALRFTALWLERSGEDFTNEAVKKYIDKVPTRKFASLMNQLTSRLLDQGHLFQRILLDLVYRICLDHPYHGMYQVWSGTKSRTNNKDEIAVLRQRATERVAKRLAQHETASRVWQAINKTNKAYHMLAIEKDSSRYKAGQKMLIKDSSAGAGLVNALVQNPIPPPTMQIELSPSRDYSHVPRVIKTEPSMTIASGVSAPKIITLVGSDGQRFKQLVKGGSDDLRQDAIMEQVFSAVSSVLKLHRSTQQRNLGIRTYKVLPLTATSGLIEFVPDTIPLHEYLMPAHERYYPKDLKGSNCRKEISQVQNRSVETRLATYKKVTERFHPVMRYFFFEYFVDPDEWFAKRTNYTRTTAAISILGHVLGLGDRHGHNILLDSVTGEVVHIDLGVAFEMGRVLPVPELVPFRLTRDIVDGMGVTKTEGVFRRCCEFTLDALREETYSIMTILDVLRYDPLYSWSISPVRMAKLQDTRHDGEAGDTGFAGGAIDLKKKGGAGGLVNEPSEADRALEVVRKKLSKTLSVAATVNDLINQAMDERNLAVLYSGWAAYA